MKYDDIIKELKSNQSLLEVSYGNTRPTFSEKSNHFSIAFNSQYEIIIEGVKTGGCQLYLSNDTTKKIKFFSSEVGNISKLISRLCILMDLLPYVTAKAKEKALPTPSLSLIGMSSISSYPVFYFDFCNIIPSYVLIPNRYTILPVHKLSPTSSLRKINGVTTTIPSPPSKSNPYGIASYSIIKNFLIKMNNDIKKTKMGKIYEDLTESSFSSPAVEESHPIIKESLTTRKCLAPTSSEFEKIKQTLPLSQYALTMSIFADQLIVKDKNNAPLFQIFFKEGKLNFAMTYDSTSSHLSIDEIITLIPLINKTVKSFKPLDSEVLDV